MFFFWFFFTKFKNSLKVLFYLQNTLSLTPFASPLLGQRENLKRRAGATGVLFTQKNIKTPFPCLTVDDSPFPHCDATPSLHSQREAAPHRRPGVVVRRQPSLHCNLWITDCQHILSSLWWQILQTWTCRTWLASSSRLRSLVTSACSSLITFTLPSSFTVGEFTMLVARLA